MAKKGQTVSDFLKAYYSKRVASNKRYSLRAFARDIGLSSGRLTNLMNGRNVPSVMTLEKIRQALNLDTCEYIELLKLAEETKSERFQNNKHDVVLGENQLGLVVDSLPFAILSLVKTQDFKMDTDFIAQRLGVNSRLAERTVENLRSAGLLVFDKGQWAPFERRITTSFDISSDQIKASHKDKLKIASFKIDEVDVSLRDFSSITFSANMTKLPEAKKIIAQFRRQLAELFETGPSEEVYCMNVQLFPLSQKESYEK